MLIEEAPDHAKPEDPIWTTTIMTYELGSLVRALVKARLKRESGDEAGTNAYVAEARVELSDLLTQAYFLAEQMGWKRLELENEGHHRFCERMKEIRQAVEGSED